MHPRKKRAPMLQLVCLLCAAEAAPVEVEGPANEESVQTVAHVQVAPTGPFTEGLFNVVDGQASIHFFFDLGVCVCNTLC